MITLTDHWPHFLYLMFVALAVGLERYWLYERFLNHELVRRGIGIVTVVAPAVLLADKSTGWGMWAVIVAGFLMAAGVKILLDVVLQDDYWRRELAEVIGGAEFNEFP